MRTISPRCAPCWPRRERPLAILGGSGWNAKACADLRKFVEANGLPAGCAFRFQDLFDNRHANYAGDIGIGINPKLAQRVKDADLLLVIGARLGEMTTSGYTLLSVPRPAQKLVHVHAGAEELGRVYQGDLLINSGMPQIAAALAAMAPVEAQRWRDWTAPRARTISNGPNPGPCRARCSCGTSSIF